MMSRDSYDLMLDLCVKSGYQMQIRICSGFYTKAVVSMYYVLLLYSLIPNGVSYHIASVWSTIKIQSKLGQCSRCLCYKNRKCLCALIGLSALRGNLFEVRYKREDFYCTMYLQCTVYICAHQDYHSSSYSRSSRIITSAQYLALPESHDKLPSPLYRKSEPLSIVKASQIMARVFFSSAQLRLRAALRPSLGATRLRYSGGRGICEGTDQVLRSTTLA